MAQEAERTAVSQHPVGRIHRAWTRFGENLRLAWQAIRTSRMRSILTMLIVAIGIMAVMGMLTVIGALVYNLENEFGALQGATLKVYGFRQTLSEHGQSRTVYHPITRQNVEMFKKLFDGPGLVGIKIGVGSVEGRYEKRKTRPNLSVRGVDYGFFDADAISLLAGRKFSPREAEGTGPLVIIGERICANLFDPPEKAIGKWILLGSLRFQVIGVLDGKSESGFGQGGDDRLLVPYKSGLARFPKYGDDYTILLRQLPGVPTEQLKDATIKTMRQVRGLRAAEADTFRIRDSDEILKGQLKSIGQVGIAAVIIALITLLGSSVGLTNIMLASVTERTREIGVRKALGAYSSTVRQQFLVESVMITVVGGAIGIVLGILIGFGVSTLMKIQFAMPWMWTLMSLALCMLVGVLSGYLPARRAAHLDPILCLHYE